MRRATATPSRSPATTRRKAGSRTVASPTRSFSNVALGELPGAAGRRPAGSLRQSASRESGRLRNHSLPRELIPMFGIPHGASRSAVSVSEGGSPRQRAPCRYPVAHDGAGCDDREFVSAREAARISGVGRTKLYALIASGRLDFIKIDKRRLVVRSSISALGLDYPTSGGSALARRRYLVDSVRNVEACRSSSCSPGG